MFKKFKKLITILVVCVLVFAMSVPTFAAYDFAPSSQPSSKSPVVKKSNGTWYYYINNAIDLSYNGLAQNSNGTWFLEDGIVEFHWTDYYNWNSSLNGAGGWNIIDSKVSVGTHLSVSESRGESVEDDNAYTGKLVVGDSRCVQLYEYNSYNNYDEASFDATWAGRYSSSYDPSIIGGSKLTHMENYIKESLQLLGYCDVYLFASINDMVSYGESAGTGYEISTATSLSDVSATFNGQTVKPTIHIIGVINAVSGNGSYQTPSSVSSWNSILETKCKDYSNWYYHDWSSCIKGYSDGLHYDTTSLGNLWSKIRECSVHEYKTFTTDSTCSTTGTKTQICIKCGNVTESTIDKKAHTYGDGVITTQPTCAKEGVETFTCTVCGATKTESVAKTTNHVYDDGFIEVQPTCTHGGYILYTCTVCGKTVEDALPASDHVWGSMAITKQPTCTEEGVTTYWCDNCDATRTLPISATGHSYEASIVEPTCTEDGYTLNTCSVCGDNYKSDIVDALGHEYETTIVEPTCTDKGCTIYKCKRCDDVYYDDYTDILDHNYKETIIEPTCLDEGYTIYECIDCGYTYEDDYVDALGHDYKDEVIEPTCIDDGYTIHICSRCGDEYIDEEVEALGHDWGEGVITKEATRLKDGEITYTCNRCGETMVESITYKEEKDYGVDIDDSTSKNANSSAYGTVEDDSNNPDEPDDPIEPTDSGDEGEDEDGDDALGETQTVSPITLMSTTSGSKPDGEDTGNGDGEDPDDEDDSDDSDSSNNNSSGNSSSSNSSSNSNSNNGSSDSDDNSSTRSAINLSGSSDGTSSQEQIQDEYLPTSTTSSSSSAGKDDGESGKEDSGISSDIENPDTTNTDNDVQSEGAHTADYSFIWIYVIVLGTAVVMVITAFRKIRFS